MLAQRISLVAMQAGVLTYRTDLPADQVAGIARTIAGNSRQALEELRHSHRAPATGCSA